MHTRNQNEEYLHTLILGSPGCGKCLSLDTPLIMYGGKTKLVQDIKVGDLLMGDDSTPRTVLSTCTGKETMYEIQQLYGDNYTVNKSHILSLKLSKGPRVQYCPNRNRYVVKWFEKDACHNKSFTYYDNDEDDVRMQAEKFRNKLPPKGTVIDISIEEYLKRNKLWKAAYKGYKVGIDFPKKDVELDPYILGYWLGDGSSSTSAITTNDDAPLDYFKQHFSDLKVYTDKITYHFSSGIKGGNINDKRNRFLTLLQKYNLLKNKHIPDEYKYTDRETRLEVLAGLLDSDGHLNNKGFDIIQKRKKLLEDIVWLARSLGFRTEMKECQKSCMYKGEKKTGTYFRTCISGNTDEIPCKIKRKQACVRKQIKDPLVYGIELKEMPENDYYGFTLDGNHRFLLGDFTVTHNTEVAKIIGKIYQAMGILSKSGPFKIAHRDDFIAEYLGQTAIKTKRLLKSCIGGVLFIDEVYSLAPTRSDRDSFAKEALDTLTAFLSEHKNDFCCIAAGYKEDVRNCFFAMNKGLERRFSWIHEIEEYSSMDLAHIFMKMVKEIKWDVSFEIKVVADIFEKNKKMFKHFGGDVETFISKAKMMHSRRVFSLSKEHKFILTKEDLLASIEYIKKNNKPVDNGPPFGMFI